MNDALANVPSPPQCSFEGQIFFYCLPSGYQPLSICLAEGLKQLGIPFYSNVDFWKISPEREDYLFRYHPNMTPDDCTVVVVEKGWVIQHHSLPENLFHPGRNYITVYLDDMDGPISPAWYPASRNFDFIFRTHLNSQAELGFLIVYLENLQSTRFPAAKQIHAGEFPRYSRQNHIDVFWRCSASPASRNG
jgi:hypothetical protein